MLGHLDQDLDRDLDRSTGPPVHGLDNRGLMNKNLHHHLCAGDQVILIVYGHRHGGDHGLCRRGRLVGRLWKTVRGVSYHEFKKAAAQLT